MFDALLNIGVIGTDGSKKLVHLRSVVGLPKIDFLKYKWPALGLSLVLVGGGFIYGLIKGKDSMLGVDFEGGFSMVVKLVDPTKAASLSKDIESGEMRKKLSEAIIAITEPEMFSSYANFNKNLFKKYNVQSIEIMRVDTEGYDGIIVNQLIFGDNL